MTVRVDKLILPPLLGRAYLVPAIRWNWKAPWSADLQTNGMWWPVIGPRHDDKEFFAFPHKHYHVDPRFLTTTHWNRVSDWNDEFGKLLSVLASPLVGKDLPDGPVDPTYRKMICTNDRIEYSRRASEPIAVKALNKNFKGTQCEKGKRGWVCPHRKVALGSVKPIDGVLTCFLHGLRIDPNTGICLGSEP